MPIPLLVTVQAAPGKEARVTELARYITDEVQKNEPAVTQYEAYKTTDKEGHVDIMIFFQYVLPSYNNRNSMSHSSLD